jgi:hypothetical protein
MPRGIRAVTAPAPIPRRLAYRALADCLGGQARHLDRLTAGRTLDRRPGAEIRPSKAHGRGVVSRRLREQADIISGWIADPARYQRPPLDAAVFGYLIALAYNHGEAMPELVAELADLGRPGLLDGLKPYDLIAILERL